MDPANQKSSAADRARLNAVLIRSKDARARRTTDQLREGLLKLIETMPIEELTVDDLIAASVVSRSTFYRHFETKEKFVNFIAEAEVEHLVAYAFPLLSRSENSGACLALVQYVHEQKALWRTLLNGGAAEVVRSRFVKLAIEIGAAQVGGDDLDLPAELGASFGVSATVEVLSWWLRQPQTISLERVAKLIERLAVRPTLYGGDAV